MKKKRKSNLQRKVLTVSVILALLIIAGGTFAWFTSKDEVINKLTAVNNYGVSITEDFTAPENWLPGQEVNKDVWAINTGNVDALVRMAFTSQMKLTYGTDNYNWQQNFNGDVLDISGMLTGLAGKELIALSEAEAAELQSGKVLMLEGTQVNREMTDASGYRPTASGIYIYTTAEEKAQLLRDAGFSFGGSTFGAYLYLTDADAQNLANAEYEAGYYAIQITRLKKSAVQPGVYAFSIEVAVPYVAERVEEIAESSLSYDFTKINDAAEPSIAVSYEDEIKINIRLASGWSTNWTWNEAEKAFYYKNTLKAGVTSEMLIDSVELDESVEGGEYKAFDYFLKVMLDSVQTTVDETGNETADAVPDTWGMQPTVTLTDGKISAIDWSVPTP